MNRLNEFMEALAVNAKLQREFQESPSTAALEFGLNELETVAVLDGDSQLIKELGHDKGEYRAFIHIQLPINREELGR